MAWKEYDYTQQWSDRFGQVYRPMLQVRLVNGDQEFSPLSLIDSGAGATMIDADIAGILGINLNPCKEIPVGGVGTTVGKVCDVILELSEFKVKETITAVFVDDLPFNVLLGQNDFFRLFDVRMEQISGKFYLRNAKPIPKH